MLLRVLRLLLRLLLLRMLHALRMRMLLRMLHVLRRLMLPAARSESLSLLRSVATRRWRSGFADQ
jgi:hypothetical protein